VDGKFLAVGNDRLWARGVTYGTFAPDADGDRFPSRDQVASDFAQMVAAGINSVRVYTTPPRWVLDAAAEAGLWVMVGLPWEQHVAFLGHRRHARSIVKRVGEAVASCAGHPAVLGYAVGNEIPAAIVRWHGRRHVERFLKRLCRAVRRADPDRLVTYVNFPSTEYLRLPFVDFLSFNVYLEDRAQFAAYVARLQNLAGERPLVLAEIGLDSRRNGLLQQASAIDSQVDVAFSGGCAGGFVFAWTDEWHRGEDEVLDWDFGVTDRRRQAKPALRRLRDAFATAPVRPLADPPTVSVVVCTHNGAATLRESLEGVLALRYPGVEAILVDDGSTDESAAIGHELGVRVISTPNRGLGAARNTGLEAAGGEIVAYLDDDACPDPDWLTYLAATFRHSNHAAVGGPNIPPPDETGVAACVANAPGGPVHVLVSDTEAEHLPGCNMAFRREALLSIGGFDPQFRVAGDDVDVCWQLHERGLTLGFHPTAMVWHRRRATIQRFWRQQRGYGRAEALLERKWPEKYNAPGHPTWGGRLYGRGVGRLTHRSRVYHGTWGTGAFQSEFEVPAGRLTQLAAVPEWYLVIAALGVVGVLGALWTPLLIALPLAGLAVMATLSNAVRGARSATFGVADGGRARRFVLRAVTLLLHLVQPAARLTGRLGHGLVPWRHVADSRFAVPTPRARELWSETWKAAEDRLRSVAGALRSEARRVRCGGPCDRWDLYIAGGALGGARLRTALEDHGRGRQLLRCRIWPHIPRAVPLTAGALGAAGAVAALQGAWFVGAVLVVLAAALIVAAVWECGIATASALRAVAKAHHRPHLELVTEDRG
jgi:O-antigen biosynthesis protein